MKVIIDLFFTQSHWVLLVMKQNEPFNPIDVRLFRAIAVMFDPKHVPDLIEELFLRHGASAELVGTGGDGGGSLPSFSPGCNGLFN